MAVNDRFVVERVPPGALSAYLGGAAFTAPVFGDKWERVGTRFFSRPIRARLVGIYQEDVGQIGYVNDKPHHEEYRVVWERQE